MAIAKIPRHALVGLERIGTAMFAISGVPSALGKNMGMLGGSRGCGFLVACAAAPCAM